MNSKRKGSTGENEVCKIFIDSGHNVHRNDQRFIGGFFNPDITVSGFDEYHFEIKRVERLNVAEAMNQARRDCGNRIPAVIHRRSREQWLITMNLSDWLVKNEKA